MTTKRGSQYTAHGDIADRHGESQCRSLKCYALFSKSAFVVPKFQSALTVRREQKWKHGIQRMYKESASLLINSLLGGRNLRRGRRGLKNKKHVLHGKASETISNQWKSPITNRMACCIITMTVGVIYTKTCQDWSRLLMEIMKMLLIYECVGWNGSILKATVRWIWIKSIWKD